MSAKSERHLRWRDPWASLAVSSVQCSMMFRVESAVISGLTTVIDNMTAHSHKDTHFVLLICKVLFIVCIALGSQTRASHDEDRVVAA